MDNFIPDIYQKSVYTIDYHKLKKDGIKCLLIDLDNTLAPPSVATPTSKVKRLFERLKKMGFKVIIFSNGSKKRVGIFKEELDVDGCYRALKPLTIKYLKIIRTLNYQESEVACIGDQIITDILGGNLAGVKTILVNHISKRDFTFTKINRLFESFLIKQLTKKRLLIIGKYYD